MKECERSSEKAEKYIDNEMTAEEKQEFEAHVAACPSCREELEFAKAVRAAVGSMEKPKVPENFMDNINKAIDKKPEKHYISRFTNFRFVSTLAACLLIAIVLSVNNNGKINDELTEKTRFHEIAKQPVGDMILSNDTDKTSEDAAAEEKTEKEEAVSTNKNTKKEVKTDKKEEQVKETETASFDKKEYPKAEDTAIAETENTAAPEMKSISLIEEHQVLSENSVADAGAADMQAESMPQNTSEKSSDNGDFGISGAASTGGGGGGNSVRMFKGEQVMYIDEEHFEKAKEAALKYGKAAEEDFEMDEYGYGEFLKYLDSIGAEYNLLNSYGDTIVFSLEIK